MLANWSGSLQIGSAFSQMTTIELLQLNLLSPVILCFFLGLLATAVKSDLRIPEPLYQALSIYLLLAIGLKGGAAIVANQGSGLWLALAAAVALSAIIPLICYPILRGVGNLRGVDAAAVAGHYGSVSVVTFLAGSSFLSAVNEPAEGFMPALVAVMEVPGIIVALLLAQRTVGTNTHWIQSIRTVVAGKSVFLLLGGIVIGVAVGEPGLGKVSAFFVDPFYGVLCIFLLEMGMVASRRFPDLRLIGPFLLAFGILMPMFNAVLGIWVGNLCGLSRGGAFLLGLLSASASYIAAPATIRLALPEASPALYLTSSLAITFPFNLTVGIPLYFALSGWLA